MKLIFKTLEFSNYLRYGENNFIDFEKNHLTQVSGINGLGKSTIVLVIEETLYNKNSRGIKKDELINWSSNAKPYSKLVFEKGDNVYTVVKSTKLQLLENGIDISGHTATQTYTMIENILGRDFSSFSKLIYQSVKSNMDFLTVTDATRKAFLVSLFNQEIYKDTENKIKPLLQESQSKLDSVLVNIRSTENKLSKIVIADKISIPEIEELDFTDSIRKIQTLELEVSEYESKYKNYLKYKKTLDNYIIKLSEYNKLSDDLYALKDKLPENLNEYLETYKSICTEQSILVSELKTINSRVKKLETETSHSSCKYCGSVLNVEQSKIALDIALEEQQLAKKHLVDIEAKCENMKTHVNNINTFKKLETVLSVGKPTLDVEVLDEPQQINSSILDQEKKNLEINKSKVKSLQKSRDDAIIFNTNIDANIKLKSTLESELENLKASVKPLEDEIVDYTILLKTFSSKGLVAYKLESYLKVFEDLINEYLSKTTENMFLLNFSLDNTKLQIILYKDGRKTSIEACSTGQQSRILIATLLAIRKLMSSINKVDININFLDEVVSFIDREGLDILINILNEEYGTNSFIISHGYTNPLVTQVEVEDLNGFSKIRIE